MVAALGGPSDLLEKPDRHLPRAPVRQAVFLDQAGVVATIDARALGLAVVALGGGRRRATDAIDPAVGLAEVRGIGETVGPDVPFAVVHAATAERCGGRGRDAQRRSRRGRRCAKSAAPAEDRRTDRVDCETTLTRCGGRPMLVKCQVSGGPCDKFL